MQIPPASAASWPVAGGFGFTAPPAASKAEAEFKDYARKTPAEKMREAILGSMGLDEAKLAAMDPKERQKIEDKIKLIMKEKIEQDAEKKTGMLVDVKA